MDLFKDFLWVLRVYLVCLLGMGSHSDSASFSIFSLVKHANLLKYHKYLQGISSKRLLIKVLYNRDSLVCLSYTIKSANTMFCAEQSAMERKE